ncbi:hypothetical protein LTR95_004518 [Oleoguttula sp. CCFEE 5521]
MPPWVSRKRSRSASPAPAPPAKKQKSTNGKVKVKAEKPTLFDDAAALEKPRSAEKSKKFLKSLAKEDTVDSDVSDADSDDFEDVPAAKGHKRETDSDDDADDDSEDDDEGMDWESAVQETGGSSIIEEPEIGDISVSMNDDGSYVQPEVNLATGKKGPSKRERQVRIQTHCLHVQALMWHNTLRNSWLNDNTLQKQLVDDLPHGVKKEFTRWREAMGMLSKEELDAKKKALVAKHKAAAKKGRKSKDGIAGRDWSYSADHLEQGRVDLSHGDPLLRLLKVLTAYWRKRFTITAPGIRKQGYKPLRRLRDEMKAWDKNRNEADDFGERIATLAEFRRLATEYEGSRDAGSQFFVALLRGLGLEARMVANLQPAGIGWSKAEEAGPKRAKEKSPQKAGPADDTESDVKPKRKLAPPKLKSALTPAQAKKGASEEKPKRKSARGEKSKPISLDDSDSPLSSAPEAEDDAESSESDTSIIDVTPMAKKKPTRKYDRDMSFPNYWAEVMSPVSHRYFPVDPVILSTIASTDDLLQSFEPRGKKAELSKQVVCYTLGYSADGSAKDVTVRYLKRHQLPGKTKGVRMPAEKIPIHNRKGKVIRYEEYDWFRTLISLYDRHEKKRTVADDLEDQTDLKPFKANKEAREVEKESLQWYKQSAEFVLEQHLRREEALIPGAESVRSFTAGKGDKAKEFPVFRRKDVVACKTVESWHKEGRAIEHGEHPFKHVPMRAVTLIRKREMEDALRETGEKLTQGLYSIDQTDWIIPPPIENGVIPKNAFGNMDVYVPTMVPKGAIHLPLKGSAKLCKRLQIDFAEACTGFEFGKQRAVPVLTGVVVAKAHEGVVRDAWRTEQAEVKRKEDTKRTAVALHWWRKMVMGLRIVERMKIDYANEGGPAGKEVNPFINRSIRAAKVKDEEVDDTQAAAEDEDMAGGFFRPGLRVEEVPERAPKRHVHEEEPGMDDRNGGGFLADEDDADMGGGFMPEEDAELSVKPKAPSYAPVTPVSLQSLHKTAGDGSDESAASDEEEVAAPLPEIRTETAKTARLSGKAPQKSTIKSKPKPRAKKSVPLPLSDEDPASLSDLSDLSSAVTATLLKPASSPKVIITPLKNENKIPMVRIRSTPLKSPYFSSQGEVDEDDLEERESEEDAETEEEVVKPRATTARTRGRA